MSQEWGFLYFKCCNQKVIVHDCYPGLMGFNCLCLCNFRVSKFIWVTVNDA